jgi:hypothetical protein
VGRCGVGVGPPFGVGVCVGGSVGREAGVEVVGPKRKCFYSLKPPRKSAVGASWASRRVAGMDVYTRDDVAPLRCRGCSRVPAPCGRAERAEVVLFLRRSNASK